MRLCVSYFNDTRTSRCHLKHTHLAHFLTWLFLQLCKTATKWLSWRVPYNWQSIQGWKLLLRHHNADTRFSHFWPFVKGIHLSLVDSFHSPPWNAEAFPLRHHWCFSTPQNRPNTTTKHLKFYSQKPLNLPFSPMHIWFIVFVQKYLLLIYR